MFKSTLVILLLIIGTTSCNEELIILAPNAADYVLENETLKAATTLKKATGSVEIIWKGGGKKSEMGNQPENLRAFFEFNAQENQKAPYSKGEIVFKVTSQDLTLHREIKANVFGVKIDTDQKKAWIVARVNSDSKGCNGGGSNDGHESGCSDEHTDDGGCSDDTSHDSGCSHDETDEGGCTDDHDDGGCSDDTSHDSGCSHDETDEGGCTDDHEDGESCSGAQPGDDSEHGSGSSGMGEKGNPVSGKNCRLNQIIVVKVHDVSTPGKDGDGLTWKWFLEENAPDIENYKNWAHLCKKEIIGGNLVVHK